MGRHAIAIAVVILCACTTPGSSPAIDAPTSPTCSPSTCAGCCAGGVCEPGDTDDACGAGGNACESCTNGCASHACAAPNPVLGKDWSRITAAAPFGARNALTVVENAGTLSLTGGPGFYDVWKSTDGTTWTAATGSVAFNAGCAASFNGSLWEFDATRSAWSSPDGATWTQQVTNTLPFLAGVGSLCVEWKSKLWVTYGTGIYSSPDGIAWTKVGTAPASGLAVVFNDQMWMLAQGTSAGAVYSSPDGVTWTPVNLSAPWLYLTAGHVAVAGGKMWLIAPTGTTDVVWSTVDGLAWDKVQATTPFGDRQNFALVAFDPLGTDPRLWLIDGYDTQTRADIWVSP